MVGLVCLKFECIVKCSPEYADDLGKDIALDLFNNFDNSVDYRSWSYNGFNIIE